MPKRYRVIIIIISLSILGFTGIILTVRAASIYQQMRGGQQLEEFVRQESGQARMNFHCDQINFGSAQQKEKLIVAIHYLTNAIKFNPRNSQAHLQLGKAYCLVGELDEAKINFQKFIELRPNNPLGYLGLGFASEYLNDRDVSKQAWINAGLTSEDFSIAGDEAFKKNDYQHAKGWYLRSLLLDRNNVQSWISLGKSYEFLEDPVAAVDAYNEAWKLNPEVSSLDYAKSLLDNGEYKTGEQVLLSVLTKFPTSSARFDWLKALTIIYLSQEEFDDAVDIYSLAIKEHPEEIDLYIDRGWAMYERGDSNSSVRNEFEKAVNLDRTSGKGYYALGQLFIREKDLPQAENWLKKAIELEPSNLWYRIILGNTTRDAGNIDKAIDIYNEIIRDHPTYDRVYFEVSLAYYLSDKFENAISAIDQAITLVTRPDPWYYIRAGYIYEKAGNREKASEYFHLALAIDPSNSAAEDGLRRLDN